MSYIIIIIWFASVGLLWFSKGILSRNIENQLRYFLYYVLVTGIIVLIWRGKDFIDDAYLANVITEFVGIFITVAIVDRIYKHISAKNEELYRKLALKMCRMPIYTYCANWLYIYESNNAQLNISLDRYESLEKFFMSDDFYNMVSAFNFNNNISANKSYAHYYDEKINEVTDRFQNILVKYASKLSHKDISLIEHFGGKAYLLKSFALMKFISGTAFTVQTGNQPATAVTPFNNHFANVNKENFQKHFKKLIEFIDEYNSVVDNQEEKWTIRNIAKLNTTASTNNNPLIEW